MTNLTPPMATMDGALSDKEIPFVAISFDYWEYPESFWGDLLRHIGELGIRCVHFEIPWGIHETGPGIFDFGEKQPSKNIVGAVAAAGALHLDVILGIGLQVSAHVPLLGYPLRIVKNPVFQALTSMNSPALVNTPPSPFVFPSLANDRIFTEFGKFLDALCGRLTPLQTPHGPIRRIASPPCRPPKGRRAPYDLDYSAESLVKYRMFLKAKYKAIDGLNEEYEAHFESFSDVPPPREGAADSAAGLRWRTDWVEYKERLRESATRRVLAMLRDRGVTVPVLQDDPTRGGMDGEKEGDDRIIFGDAFDGQADGQPPGSIDRHRSLVRSIRYRSGNDRRSAPSYMPLGSRYWDGDVQSQREREFQALLRIMHGRNGLILQRTIQSETWKGVRQLEQADVRIVYPDMLRQIVRLLDQHKLAETAPARTALVILDPGRDIERRVTRRFDVPCLGFFELPAEVLEDRASPDALREAGGLLGEESWIDGMLASLSRCQVDYDLADSVHPQEIPMKYQWVITPCLESLDREDQDACFRFVEQGGRLIAGGAKAARQGGSTTDNRSPGSPESEFRGKGRITRLRKLEEMDLVLERENSQTAIADNRSLDVVWRTGANTVLWIANPTEVDQETNLAVPFPLVGIHNTAQRLSAGTVRHVIPPRMIQIWEKES